MPLDPSLDPLIEAASLQHNVDPALLRATLLTESSGNPRAVSRGGAQGIAQLMPDTARGLGVADPFDEKQAIPAAAQYLAEGLRKYGDPEKALMYYHGGPDESKWGEKTAAYPRTVAQHYATLSGASPVRQPQGIDALATARGTPTPMAGQIAANFTAPPGTPDTLDAAPPGVAALAALSGQGTAPPPRVMPLAGSAQTAQAAVPTDDELIGLLKARGANAGGGVAAVPQVGAEINPAAIDEANRNILRNTLLGRPINPIDVEVAKRAPGLSGDPEYQRQLEAARAGGAKAGALPYVGPEAEAAAAGQKQQRLNPATGQYENAPGSVESTAAMAGGVRKAEAEAGVGAAVSTEIGARSAKDFFDRRASAIDAVKSLESANEARSLLDQGIVTGTGAQFIVNMNKMLDQVGIKSLDPKISNTEAFTSARAQEVGRIIKQFGSGTGLSDADREYANKMAGGQIGLTEESIRKILDINDRATRNIINNFNEEASKIKSPGAMFPLTVPEPRPLPRVAQPGNRPGAAPAPVAAPPIPGATLGDDGRWRVIRDGKTHILIPPGQGAR